MGKTHLNLSSFIVFGMLIHILKIVVYLDENRHMCVDITKSY